MASDRAKLKAFWRGIRAEKIAAWWLRLKGYHIAAHRYKTHLGEIDLIARRGNCIAIVEVKARPTLIEAMDAVTRLSAKRIEAAADLWLSNQPDREKLYVRFDMIAILPYHLPKHFPAFFQSSNQN